MLPFIAALAPLIPSLIGLADDKAGRLAERLVPAVQVLAGSGPSTPQALAAALRADPARLLEAQRMAAETLLALERDETERLRIVNASMQAEAASSDPFVRRMRPFFGYVMALSWGAQMAAASWTIVADPARAGEILRGLAETTALWGLGLAVLGVYVWKRSSEKAPGWQQAALSTRAG
ncbi:3TM-type holin [Arenibaculum pallidiluteum]|uniref:3TM-type holin n=1 Tax=Arenibaculum pallidiluteum TaxID=2812559 RepID=UPI001A965583|nr:3TM-type holin [Arenibaculum pallidiluteum]